MSNVNVMLFNQWRKKVAALTKRVDELEAIVKELQKAERPKYARKNKEQI